MKSWRYNLALLWASQLVVLCGFAAMIPFIPLLFKHELQITNPGELGKFISLFNLAGAVGYGIFCPLWGKLSDRFGVKPMLLRGTFLTGVIFPLMAYTRDPWLLVILRFISAACAGTTSASQIMVARTAPLERQGVAQGILSTGYWGGTVLGNVVGGLVIHWYGYRTAFWVCGILYFLAGTFILFTEEKKPLTPPPAAVPEKSSGWSGLPPAVWSLLLLFLLMSALRGYDSPYLAIKVESLTGTANAAGWTGIASAVICGGAIISGAVTGTLADRLKPALLVIPSLLLSAAAAAVSGLSTNLTALIAAQTLLFIAAGSLQPILQKQLTLNTPLNQRGSAFGLASMFSSIGGMLAALAAGQVFGHGSVQWVYYSGALLYAAALPLFLRLLPRQPRLRVLTAGKNAGSPYRIEDISTVSHQKQK